MDKIVLISVVRDFAMYERCVKDNPFVAGAELCPIDNRAKNEGIPVGYNRFLDSRPADEQAWYVFCHEDFQLLEPIADVFAPTRFAAAEGLHPADCLWGPIGAATQVRFGLYHQWQLRGSVEECRKDGSNRRAIGTAAPAGTPVETFDCQCLVVHSSLVARHHLRFDEKLTFDLYVEDFCLAAQVAGCGKPRVLPMKACHWSGGRVQPRYYVQEAHVNAKYPNLCSTGTSSLILGGNPPFGRRLTVALKKLVRGWRR